MFGNNQKSEMIQINRKSSRKFAEARKLDEKELAQALVEVGLWKPIEIEEDIIPTSPLSPALTSPEIKK